MRAMEDIEDLCKMGLGLQQGLWSGLEGVVGDEEVVLALKNEGDMDDNSCGLSGDLPGIGKVYIKTWGCAHNSSDSEYMAGLLSEYGFRVVFEVEESENADVWLLNSCTVKNPSESHFVNFIGTARSKGKKVVLAGCVPQSWGSEFKCDGIEGFEELSIIGVRQIDRIVEVVEETLKGNAIRVMGGNRRSIGGIGATLNLPKIRKNKYIEIVPISDGCLNKCTYCKTKYARGDLMSYSIEEIVSRIADVISNNQVLEIWLTSEDTGAYGIDIGTNIVELLWRILDILPEPIMLRLGMSNPPYILNHLDEMVKIYKHPRMYRYLHIPVQSGSNQILRIMRREYKIEEFCTIIDAMKKCVENLTIATDLIVGFPGEDDEDFEATWNLVQKYKFPVLFTNQFYPRPGTPAAHMRPRVPSQKVKERTRKISTWFKNFFPYENRIGERHLILVTEIAPDKRHFSGRTKSYEMVLIPRNEHYMGKLLPVTIVETGKFYLRGRVEDGNKLPPLIENTPITNKKNRNSNSSELIRARKNKRPKLRNAEPCDEKVAEKDKDKSIPEGGTSGVVDNNNHEENEGKIRILASLMNYGKGIALTRVFDECLDRFKFQCLFISFVMITYPIWKCVIKHFL